MEKKHATYSVECILVEYDKVADRSCLEEEELLCGVRLLDDALPKWGYLLGLQERGWTHLAEPHQDDFE